MTNTQIDAELRRRRMGPETFALYSPESGRRALRRNNINARMPAASSAAAEAATAEAAAAAEAAAPEAPAPVVEPVAAPVVSPAASPVVSPLVSLALAPVAGVSRWHPAHRTIWFRELMEELEPLHDCTEARLGEHVCVINNILSIINWDILRDIESIHIAESSKMNDSVIPDDKHKLTDLDDRIISRARALDKANDETVGTEVAIQVLVGEYISRLLPVEFPTNIHKIIGYVGKKEKKNKQHRTVAFTKESVDLLFSEWKSSDIFYSEATGIGSITKYIKKHGISPIEIATRYVDPSSTKKTTVSLSFTGFSDDLIELLGNITCTVNPGVSSNSNTSTNSTNNDESTDTNMTTVIAEKFKEYPLLTFPTAAAAGLVSNILHIYHNEREREVNKTKMSKPKQVIEAVKYLNESQNSIVDEITDNKTNSSANHVSSLPEDTLTKLLHDLILSGANKLIQIADEAERGEYKPKESESSGSDSINSKEVGRELGSLSRPMNVRELGNVSKANIARYAASFQGPSPALSNARSRRPKSTSGYETNQSMFEIRNGTIRPTNDLLPQIAKEYEKSLKNINNFVQLVKLAVNIYERLHKSNPQTALQITMRTVLHLKSYGDSFQLKELDSIMRKPENAGKVLWLTSIDRIFLALAGLYAIDGGWNLMTIQQSSTKGSKDLLILRDYRRSTIPSVLLPPRPLPPPPKKLTKKIPSRRGLPRLGPKSIIYSSPQETARKSAMRAAATARLTRAQGTRRSGRFLSPLAPSSPSSASQFAFAPSSRSAFGAPAPAPAPAPPPVNPANLRINLPNMPAARTAAGELRNLVLSPIQSTTPQGALSSLSRGYNPSPNSNKKGGSRHYKQRKTLKKRKGKRHTRRRT